MGRADFRNGTREFCFGRVNLHMRRSDSRWLWTVQQVVPVSSSLKRGVVTVPMLYS